jgi:hypothetical protein
MPRSEPKMPDPDPIRTIQPSLADRSTVGCTIVRAAITSSFLLRRWSWGLAQLERRQAEADLHARLEVQLIGEAHPTIPSCSSASRA